MKSHRRCNFGLKRVLYWYSTRREWCIAHMDMHVATCGYCWKARAQLYHKCIRIDSSKSAWLRCCYCARIYEALGSWWMIYPCGWWELEETDCRCAYFDMLGYRFSDGDPIFAKDKFLMEHVKQLRIDYIHGHELVKFVGKRKIDDARYSDDHHGELFLSDVITIKAFRIILPLMKYFLKHTRQKLHSLRKNSMILRSLPLVAIKRFCWSNRTFRSSVLFVSSPTDATLVSYVYKSKTHQEPHDTMESAWQWQQFTNPLTDGKWFWREADGEWFNMNPNQCRGDGPAGTWFRYKDPTSHCYFWWRNNEDWGWERHPEGFHSLNRSSSFQDPQA